MTSQTIAPVVAVNDIGDADAFLAAIDLTIKYFDDGDIVEGTIVKVDRDEVLLDIGYKTEGVIPSRDQKRSEPCQPGPQHRNCPRHAGTCRIPRDRHS